MIRIRQEARPKKGDYFFMGRSMNNPFNFARMDSDTSAFVLNGTYRMTLEADGVFRIDATGERLAHYRVLCIANDAPRDYQDAFCWYRGKFGEAD